MAKKFIKRYLPDPKKIQKNKYLKIFGKLLDNPNLWHFNRSGIATGSSIGLFVTFIPFPGHMIVAALLSILLRANLPISLAMAWVVNPLTMIPIYGFAYTIGALFLGGSLQDLNFHSFSDFQVVWQPFMLGCLLCGTFLAATSNILVRLYWRYSVTKSWHRRQLKRKALKYPSQATH